MVEELAVLLHNRVDPSVWDGVLALTQALEQHRAILYKDRLARLVMEANNLDSVTLVDETMGIIYGQVEALLSQMQIRLDYDCLNHQRVAEILTVFLFHPNDLDEQALAAIGQGDDGVETLTEVLAVYLNEEPVALIEAVVEVGEDVIPVIELVLQQNLSYQDEAVEGVQETVALMNRHQDLVGQNVTLGMEALKEGTAVSTAFEELVQQHREQLQNVPDDQLGDQLLSLALLARVDHIALKEEIMHFVEALRDDPIAIQRVYKRLIPRIDQLRSLIHEPT